MEKIRFIEERDKFGKPTFLIYVFQCCAVLCQLDLMTMKPETINFTEIMAGKKLWIMMLENERYGLEWLMLYHLSMNVLHIFDNDSMNTLYANAKKISSVQNCWYVPLFVWLNFLRSAVHALLIEIFMAQQSVVCVCGTTPTPTASLAGE